jgi:ABC-2 type transport system ATP-binding protein
MESRFRECVRELRTEGRTVLLSSHVLSEVEALCEFVTIIRRGRTVEAGTLAGMRHLSVTAVDVETARPLDLADVPGVRDVDVDGLRSTFQVDTDHLQGVLERVAAAGVQSMVSRPPSLEEMFLQLYGDEPAAHGSARG